MRRLATSLAISAALAACGWNDKPPGAPPAANQVNGTVDGQPLAAADAIARALVVKGDAFTGTSLSIDVTTWADACAKEAASAGVKDGKAIWLNVVATDANGSASPPSAPGDYAIAPGGLPAHAPNALLADVWYQANDASCLPATKHQALSGKVTLTAISAAGAQGTFDVVLDTGDHVTGSFDARTCDAYDPNRTPLATCT